jgi:hypothetical protein
MALNKNIVRSFDCFLVGVLGNVGVSLALFHFKILSAVDSLLIGTVVGILTGLTLAALFWGKL